MKKTMTTTLIATGLLFAGTIQAKTYMNPVVEANLVKICEAIKSDNKLKLHRTIKQSGLNMKQINKGLVCNGQSPHDFALANDAEKNAKFIAAKTNTKQSTLVAKL